MRSKLIVPGFVAASLLVPAVAFAQSETAAPAETAAPHAAKPAAHHAMKSAHMKPGTTTGMSSSTNRTRPGGQAVSRKPAD